MSRILSSQSVLLLYVRSILMAFRYRSCLRSARASSAHSETLPLTPFHTLTHPFNSDSQRLAEADKQMGEVTCRTQKPRKEQALRQSILLTRAAAMTALTLDHTHDLHTTESAPRSLRTQPALHLMLDAELLSLYPALYSHCTHITPR